MTPLSYFHTFRILIKNINFYFHNSSVSIVTRALHVEYFSLFNFKSQRFQVILRKKKYTRPSDEQAKENTLLF